MISPMSLSSLLVSAATLLASACASSSPEIAPAPVGPAPTPVVVGAAPVAAPAPAPAPRTCDMFLKPGVIKRASLVAVVDAGMARWLQSVEGDRSLGNHRFQGWLIKSLHPADPCYQQVDLRPGDVVRKVNARSIEKPDQAFEVFESMRTAPALVVDYVRAGKPGQVTLQIAD